MSNFVSKIKEFWVGDPESEVYQDNGDGFEQLFQINQKEAQKKQSTSADSNQASGDPAAAKLHVVDDYYATNEVIVYEPTNFGQAVEVIKYLKKGSSVVLNVTKLEESDPVNSQRLIDFVCGGVFALDGSQKRIGEGVFLLVPNSVNINTVEKKELKSTKFWNTES